MLSKDEPKFEVARLKRRAFNSLRRFALKAAHGKPLPWKAERYVDPKGQSFWSVDVMTSGNSGWGIGPIYKELNRTYAQYIAAASPKTILLLLDDLESLECKKEARVDELLDALRNVKQLISATQTRLAANIMDEINDILDQYKEKTD